MKPIIQQPSPSSQRYLVTGSAGYIGRHVVQGLLSQSVGLVHGICLPGSPKQLTEKRGFISIEQDLLDPNLPEVLESVQPDVIIHAVGLDRQASLKEQLNVNVEGTRHLLQSIVDAGLTSRVIIIGSAAEYGPYPKAVDETLTLQPVTDYGVSKYAQSLVAQLFARKHHIPVIITRLFNPYGQSSEQYVIASLAAQIARIEMAMEEDESAVSQLYANRLDCFRDFIHIKDVVSGLIALAERGYPGEVYNLASGQAVPLRLVLEGLLNFSPLKKKQLELRIKTNEENEFSQGAIQKIITHTGWRPQMTLEQGLKEELTYWRNHIKNSPVLLTN